MGLASKPGRPRNTGERVCAYLRLKTTGEKNAPNMPFNVTSKVWIPQTMKGRSSILGARPSVY